MSVNRDTIVEIFGANGDHVTIAGEGWGDEGFVMATGPQQLYDPPVKVVYEEPGNWPGARFLSYRVLRRDVILPVWILDDDEESWAYRDSRLRMMFDYEQTARIRVTHPEWPYRELTVTLGEQYEVDLVTDPNLGEINLATIHLIAGDPFWYEADARFSGVTATDTTFDPNPPSVSVAAGASPVRGDHDLGSAR